MAKWKLCRQTYSNDTYEFTEGDEITIGRGTQNTIVLPSLNISRRHCVITVKKDEVIIEDLKSANGIFVGLKKIPPNIPFSLSNNDIIGLGWTDGAPLARVNDAEQFVFKLLKISNDLSIIDRIQFQNETSVKANEIQNQPSNMPLPKGLDTIPNLLLKRKCNTETGSSDESNVYDANKKNINGCSDENMINPSSKKFKPNIMYEDEKDDINIKIESEDERYEAFTIKQECFDDEIQIVDSDSDSEQWYIRLSQNSPRKSLSSFNENRISEDCQPDSSYSQLDDDVIFVKTEMNTEVKTEVKQVESDEEQYEDDLICILPPPVDIYDGTYNCKSINSNNEIIKNSANNVTPIINTSNDVIENKKQIENETDNLFSNLSPPVNKLDILLGNKSKKQDEVVNNNMNGLREIRNPTSDSSPKLTESIQRMMCGSHTKEPYNLQSQPTTVKSFDKAYTTKIADYKSQSGKKATHISKGKVKKKNSKSKSSSSKIQITNSQKEERKKKLREIASKDKGEVNQLYSCNILRNEECSTTTSKISAKVSSSNRGAFLIDTNPIILKPVIKKKNTKDNESSSKDKLLKDANDCDEGQAKTGTRKSLENKGRKDEKPVPHDEKKDHKSKHERKNDKLNCRHNKNRTLSADATSQPTTAISHSDIRRRNSENLTKELHNKKTPPDLFTNIENLVSKNTSEKPKDSILQLKRKEEPLVDDNFSVNSDKIPIEHKEGNSKQKDAAGPIKLSFKAPTSSDNVNKMLKSSIKTILKPMKENKEPKEIKNNKKVRFSDVQPKVIEFEIELGNQMKKTNTAKSSLPATRHDVPVLSLQKIALMKILRWNPQWLKEQNEVPQPPPILGHNNVPMAILHSFNNHTQYVELIGDLLLMEIWECLTQGYIKACIDNKFLEMRIESLPLVPPQRRSQELIHLNVNVSVPTVQGHTIPREGEIMIFNFGHEQIGRFFFVHNVRCLPSPPNNVNSFYSISLQTLFTDKIRALQRGAVIYGRKLAYINKDLRLFEVMEYLSRSPLMEVVLNPQPKHFAQSDVDHACNMESQWTASLNDSQKKAVLHAVSAANGERPRINMIQGPPGTGKSRVICSIVMEYFYDGAGRRQKSRGKILLCATSNAAIDELVIRLLDIRQSLPQGERLRLVRVGRAEAMHPRARDISSLKLAQRDAARSQPDPPAHQAALSAEISLLEAKKNMWHTKAMSAGDDARVAYCQGRVAEITKKIAMFRGGGGGAACGPEQVAQAERRVLDCADVLLTTLAGAHAHKMRGLSGRIALCIVDEAGQAIEPETLAPLALGVTRLALVGDPQQLPGFICSQRAKQHGLGESLFARLASCAEAWPAGGPVLLDRQYRMHPHIADYPNRAFYGGRVRSEPPPRALVPDLAPYFVLGIIGPDNGQDVSGANEAEAWGAARVALALRWRLRGAAPADAHSLAVITPYAAQRDLVRRHVRTLLQAEGAAAGAGGAGAGEEGEVEVNTVDSFQGQERAAVVVSLARSHGLGFLAAAGRMNVMLTRAKHALVLCLNPRAVESNPQWRSLVEDAQRRNLYGTLPIQMCQHPSAQHVSNQEILQYLSSKPPVDSTRNPSHQFKRGSYQKKNYKRRQKY